MDCEHGRLGRSELGGRDQRIAIRLIKLERLARPRGISRIASKCDSVTCRDPE